MRTARIQPPSPMALLVVGISLLAAVYPSRGFQCVAPFSGKDLSRHIILTRWQPSGSSLNMINFSGDGNKPSEKKAAADAKEKSRRKATSKATQNKDKKEQLGDGEEDESFSAFLQRISQFPGVDDVREDKEQNTLDSATAPRNPFLSPFASLLNFEEIVSSTKEEIPGVQKLEQEGIDEINAWGSFVASLKQSFGELSNETMPIQAPPPQKLASAPQNLADDIVKEASNRVESMVTAASTAVSPTVFSSIIKQARNALKFQDDLVEVATSVARDRGLDDSEAAERARNTTDYVADLVSTADSLLRFGYVKKEEDAVIGDRKRRKKDAEEILEGSVPTSSGTLFESIKSARPVSYAEFGPAISTLAEMGWLSGGIYENEVERPHQLGHSVVAEGITADVYWMVTDSLENEDDFKERDDNGKGKDISVRTIIVRGFDASDERVDREKLFTEICNLQARPFDDKYSDVLVHQGLFKIATKVYRDIEKYINWSAPAQKIVFTGHSVGGTLSILLTLMLARDRGGKISGLRSLVVTTCAV